MRRITGLPDEQVATYEERIEAVIAAQLQAIMDRIADRIASIQVASAVQVMQVDLKIPYPDNASSVQTLIAADEPPGQPYVSPDDLAPITPMWQQAVGEAIMPIAVEVFQAAAGIVYGQIVDATGVPFPAVGSLAAEQYLAGARNTFDDIGNDLWETARGQLLDGFEQGESIPELTQRLRNSAGMTSKTATLVGRTKVIEASNAGSIAIARASGLEMEKEWLATPDPRTRPTHLAADGQRVALHEPFIVGGYPADFPADPSLPPAESFNCRCAIGYIMPERTVRESREQAVIDEGQATLPGTSPAEPIPEGMRAVSGAPGVQRTLTDLEPPESPKRVFQQLPNPTPPTWRPGAWTESNLLRAREDIAEREFRQYVDTQERFDLAVDESYGRQLGRGIAVQEVPDDARAFVNGDILVVVRSPDLVSEDVRRAVMTQLDALQEANPVDRPFTVRLWGQASPTGNKAMTGPDAISMFGELKLAINSKRATSRFLMPSAGETGESIYDLTHEYGHALMFQRGHGALASRLYDELDLKRRGDEGRIIPTKDTLGYYATEDYKEAYAEAFAEWHLSAGLTENPMVLRYAQTFGWRSPLDVDDARSRLPGGLDVDLADEFVVAPTVIRPALRAAKTERELQQAWRVEYQRISGRDILIQVPPNPSMATMRQYAEGTLQALERFPEAKIGEISWWSQAGGAYAQVIPGGRYGATLQFNAFWAAKTERAALLRAMRGDQSGWEKPGRDGWSTRGAGSPTATAYHEFAHVLDLENTGGRIGPQALAAVRRAAGREGIDDDTLVGRDISIYAGSDVNEMIAEAFTDVMVRGPQASPISREIYDLVVVEYRRGGYGLRMAPALDELDDEARVFARRPAPAKVRIDRSGSAGEILDEERRVKSQALSAPPVKLADLAAASPNGVKTRALYYYQRFGDEHMNGLLVRGKVGAPPGVKRADLPSEEKVRESIARLDSIMDESVLTEEIVTYRGLANLRTVFPGSHEPGSLVGKTFTDKRFVSTSADRGVAEQFMVGEGQRAQGALLEIISPRGTKAIQISNADFMGKSSSVTSEFEILLQRGLRYRVISDEMRPMPFVRFAGGTREPAFERDPIRHLVVEVIHDEPSVSAPVIAPVANARTPLAALRDMARARGIDTAGVRKADLVRLVNETPELGRPAGSVEFDRVAAAAKKGNAATAQTGYRFSGNANQNADLFPNRAERVKIMDAFAGYRGVGSARINRALRAGTPEADTRIAEMDKAFAASPLRGDVLVYRGARGVFEFGPASEWGDSLAGRTWTDRAFTSTSVSVEKARPFASDGVMLRIVAPKGTHAVGIRPAARIEVREQEILLDRDMTFRVVADHGSTPPPGIAAAVADSDRAAVRRFLDVEVVPNVKPALSPAQIQRAAARARHAQIAQGEGTAKLLAEIDELISKGATRAQLRQSLDPALIAPDSLFANADRAVLDALRDALDTGDAAKLKAAVTRLSTKSKVKVVGGRAGAKAKFDPDTMEGFGGADIPAGAQVQIVRRGSSLTMPDGEVIPLEKARVVAIEPKPKPVSAAEKRRLAAVERQATIDRKRGLADVLAEIDELLDSGASTRALRARLTARNKLVRLPDDQIDALLAAVDDRDQLATVVARLAGDAEIERVGLAGRVVVFDPKIHEGIAAGIRPGQSVRILRPGYTWRDADGDTVNLRRAEVIVTDDKIDAVEPVPQVFRNRSAPSVTEIIDRTKGAGISTMTDREYQAFLNDLSVDFQAAIGGKFGNLWVVVDPKSLQASPAQVVFRGKILDANGKKVGSFSRSISPDNTRGGELVAWHSNLKLNRDVQGSGFAHEFNQNLFDWYRRSGVKRVTLGANIDVGGYAWAAQGFDFADVQAAKDFVKWAREKIDAGLKRTPKGLSREQVTALDAYLRQIESGDVKASAPDIARFGRLPGQGGKDATWPGKWLMLRSGWLGTLHL